MPSSFSIVDIINNLYSFHLRNMKSKKISARDVFVLSKGHGCVALYVVLKNLILSKKEMRTLYKKKWYFEVVILTQIRLMV